MYRIKTLNAISDAIYEHLDQSQFIVSDQAEDPDGILVRSADCKSMELNDSLVAIARAGAGTNNIPISRCTEAGVVVFNTPGANANAVKELVLCSMLLASRNVLEGIAWANDLKGEDIPGQVERGKKQFVGNELYGKTLGVIGLGAIGVMVANDAHAIGMNVIGYDPFISVEHAWGLSRAIVRGTSLSDLLHQADYLTIHVPLMEKTRNYINEAALSQMKDGAVLLNLARAEIVDQAAVLKALEQGKLSRYVTDFPTEELIGKEKVILIPHLGASTPESEENCARMAAKELYAYIVHGNIENSVNMPNGSLPISGSVRVCILHKNVKNMVGQITSILGAGGHNIANMLNKSKEDLAYTIIDLDNVVTDEELKQMKAISDVIRVRVLVHGA